MVPILISSFLLEKKVYGENSTPEEIAAIKAMVYSHDERVIVYKEIQIMSEFSINTMFDQLEYLLESTGISAVVFDISQTSPPSFKLRSLLYKRFESIQKIVDVSGYVTGNGLMTIAFKFFMNSSKSPAIHSFCSSNFETVLQKVYDKIDRK